ncbi:MAG: T9SS type A sorting domain-containing protein [Bacteroidota bacterium]
MYHIKQIAPFLFPGIFALLLPAFITAAFGQRLCPPSVISTCLPTRFCIGDSIKLEAPTAYGRVSTFAGTIYGKSNGPAAIATYRTPEGLTFDQTGNMYIADAGNGLIRKISTAGQVSTFSGSPYNYARMFVRDGNLENASFIYPGCITTDLAGNIFVGSRQSHSIRRISPSGIVSTYAGDAFSAGFRNDTGIAARFNYIQSMATDAAGNLYVADGNHCIRKITPDRQVTTFAGTPGSAGYIDGSASTAKFDNPIGLTFDLTGNLIVCDYKNNRIRKISTSGIVSTLAGSGVNGNNDGIGLSAETGKPLHITRGPDGVLYFDNAAGYIRKITADLRVTTISGDGQGGNTDGFGSAASFAMPLGITFGPDGFLYIADALNQNIRKVSIAGLAATFSGIGYNDRQNGPALQASFFNITQIAPDKFGNIYISDNYANEIRKISVTGQVNSVAGGNGNGFSDGVGGAARFQGPQGIACDNDGNVFVADAGNNTIRKITPDGTVSTFAGQAGIQGYTNGNANEALFNYPTNLVFDPAGNLYVSDGNFVIRKITPGGIVSTFSGTGTPGYSDGPADSSSFTSITSVSFSPDSNIYISDGGMIRRLGPNGRVTTLGNSSYTGNYNNPCINAFSNAGITFDTKGNMYFSDSQGLIRKITREGLQTELAGERGKFDYIDSTGKYAGFLAPGAISADNNNNLIVADPRILRKVNLVDADGFLWSNGEFGPYIYAKDTGYYSVKVIYGSCTSTVGVPVHITHIPYPDRPTISRNNDTLRAGPYADTYAWYFNDTLLTGYYGPFIYDQQPGSYTVAGVSEGMCTSAVSLPYIITGISNKNAPSNLSISPNPNTGLFTIKGLSEQSPITIINSLGQTIFRGRFSAETPVNIQNIPAGIYRLFAEGRQLTLVKTD